MKKGQSAVEYLAIAVVALAVFTPIAVYAFSAVQENTGRTGAAQATNTVEQLRNAADTVCGLPNGSLQRITVTVPHQTDSQLSGFGKIHSRALHLSLHTSERAENVTGVTTCNVTGTFPNRTGPVTFELLKLDDNQVHFTAP